MPREIAIRPRLRDRIERFLSGVAAVRPDINITSSTGDIGEIAYNPADECSLPLIPRAKGFYADYAPNGELLETTFVWYQREFRRRHARLMEQYQAGGYWLDDGRFHPGWHHRHLYRVTPVRVQLQSDLCSPHVYDRIISPRRRVEWIDDENCVGPEQGRLLYSENSVVEVLGKSHECARAIYLHPGRPCEAEASSECEMLSDSYVRSDGRIVLTRRFISQRFYEEDSFREVPWSEYSTGRRKIVYNGIEFRHDFDILTDIALGWPAPPPIR